MALFSNTKKSANQVATSSPIYHQLDVWRALAAIWVVMDHACSTVITDTKVVANSASFIAKPYVALSLSGQLGVTIFFVISGYCIVLAADNTIKKQRKFSDFLIARLRRIYPPYYASIILATILPFIFVLAAKIGVIPMPNHGSDLFNNSFVFYFSHLTLTQELFHVKPLMAIYWSLCYEVAFYVVVTAMLFINQKLKIDFHLLIFAVTTLSLLWMILLPIACPFPFNLWYLFGSGAMVYMLNRNVKVLKSQVFFVITSVLVLAFAYVQPGSYRFIHPTAQTQAVFGLIFSIIILFLYQYDNAIMKIKIIKAIAYLGAISYSLYLSHPVIISIPRQIMIKLGFVNDKYWVTFIVQVVIGIAFSYVFHVICERPFMSSQSKLRDVKPQV